LFSFVFPSSRSEGKIPARDSPALSFRELFFTHNTAAMDANVNKISARLVDTRIKRHIKEKLHARSRENANKCFAAND
jgi:hypothetical protein